MKKKLFIISNEKFYLDEKKYFCDHIAEKTLPDGLNSKFDVTIIGRSTNIKRAHQLKIKNIENYNFLISYLIAIFKKLLKGESKFLILSISPYTFLASLIFIFFRSKPLVYLRSNGYEEYKSILGFYGPLLYGAMFKIVSKISFFISCREHILKGKPGHLVLPSELTNNWISNTSQPNYKNVRLLYVGRVKVEKGIFSLVRLLERLPNEVSLSIVGETEQTRIDLRKDNISIFPIERDEKKLIKYYDDHSIFILPSYTEGHPMVLLEALARMRPVIIFNEIKHVIGEKKGIFVADRNVSSVNKIIEHIKDNKDKIYEEMKQNKLPTKEKFLIKFSDLISTLN